MLKNYITISLRNLFGDKLHSLINIAGLGVSLSVCLLILLWVFNELSYDRFHTKGSRIYRPGLEVSFGGQSTKLGLSQAKLLGALLEHSGVETGARLYYSTAGRAYIIEVDGQRFEEHNFYFTDSTFFDVFSFPLIEGNPKKALAKPKSVVLSKSTAKKYFQDNDALGKSIRVNQTEYTISGIMEDAPLNSFHRPELIASFTTPPESDTEGWGPANFETYVVLKEGADLNTIISQTNDIVKKYNPMPGENDYLRYSFIPLFDIYLKSDARESVTTGSIQNVYIFSAIGLLILLVACINYINLTTAKSIRRGREVGVRKSVGALRREIFIQFLLESSIATFSAFTLGTILTTLALPLFNILTGKTFSIVSLLNPSFIAISIGLLITIILLAGTYPALILSNFMPAKVLKGNFATSQQGASQSKILLVIQFSISLGLIISTIFIQQQLTYLQDKKLGYDSDLVVQIPLDRQTKNAYNQLRTEFIKDQHVNHVSRATESPVLIRGGYTIRSMKLTNPVLVSAMNADEEFIPTMNMELLAGRNFTEGDFSTLRADFVLSFIVNEQALIELNLSIEEAIGARLEMDEGSGPIVGVIKDFHFSSLHEPIRPLVLFTEDNNYHWMFLKLLPGNIPDRIASIEKTYTKLISHRPFELQFVESRLESMYQNELKLSNLSKVLSGISILIAYLGLFGMISLNFTHRIKEIGIRKILGAGAFHNLALLASGFLKQIIFSLALGIACSWYFVIQWLESFAYRINIGVTPFIIASIATLVLAIATIFIKTIQASKLNPIVAIKVEN